ncbi:EAL domain-containing protein [Sphingomonas sp. ASV193]|uniref:putative bifunctional diguanylate cyclase/phosphodiesterase n=1 Tax=Sphingomonas sp. ASV193 TaxID=3144405 RepID=UPI0032E909FD
MIRGRFQFRSLRARLAAGYGGLFALVMALVVAILWISVDRIGGRDVVQQMGASSAVFDRLWDQRAREMQASAALVARDFGFRAAVATGDEATVTSALDNLQGRRRADLAAILSQDGRVMGRVAPLEKADVARLWDSLDEGKMTGVVRIAGRARQVSAAPIMAPTNIGWVVFATDIDQRELDSLERLSAIPIHAGVASSAPPNPAWTMVAGDIRLDPAARAAIETSLHDQEATSLSVGGEENIAFVKSLPAMVAGERAALLLYYPRSEAIAAYRPVKQIVLLVGLIGILLVAYASLRGARRITEPLGRLDRAAGRLAEGERTVLAVEGEDELARLAAGFNRMAEQIEERERRITELAYNDGLTGLANRAMFQRHVDLLLANNTNQLALFCLDLDHFKTVNDSLGHHAGDRLLVEIARRLREAAGSCFIARLGGDEFVVVQPLSGERGEVDRLAEAMLGAVRQPIEIDGHHIVPGTSIGVAFAPVDGKDVATLMKAADLALYRAKSEGRGVCSFFERDMNERAQARRRIESDLGIAIERGEFELHFQPLFDLADQKVCAFEALIRWNHPSRGQISPVEFVPVAEDTGLIVPIGRWVIEEACRRAASWPAPLRVAVNVSSIQFRRPGLGEQIVSALEASGLDPARLEIEITESVFLDGDEATLRQLHSLKRLGIRIALDDFGTGYSSLSYLQSFPFDKLKIDRSFIQALMTKPNASAVVKSITELARALGMETTAEGVEENAQLMALIAHGCSSVQGFLLSRPLSAMQVDDLLRSKGLPVTGRAERATPTDRAAG